MRLWPVIFLFPLVLAAQAPVRAPVEIDTFEVDPEEACSLSGRVVNAVSGEGLRNARIQLRMREAAAQVLRGTFTTTTDGEGGFAMAGLAPGTYELIVQRSGFLSSAYGVRGQNTLGSPLTLKARDAIRDLRVEMKPGGVIAGRVADEFGEPVERARVQIMRYRYVNGERMLAPQGNATTNDLGEYRAFGLAPGRYYVLASPSFSVTGSVDRSAEEGPREGYVPIYYPGATEVEQASPINVAEGTRLLGIDFQLTRRPTYRVVAHVDNQTGVSGSIMALLRPSGGAISGANMSFTPATRDNQVRFDGLIPGTYTIMLAMSEAGRAYSGRDDIEVADRDLTGLVVRLAPGTDVPGVVEVEGSFPLDLTSLRVTARGAANQSTRLMTGAGGGGTFTFGTMANEQLDSEGRFALPELPPDESRVRVEGLPDEFYLKSMRMEDQDVLDGGLNLAYGAGGDLRIVLSDRAGIVSGNVADEDGNPVTGATAVLVPDAVGRQGNDLFYRNANTDQQGRFQVTNVHPGEYKLYAWDGIEAMSWLDPYVLEPYRTKATPVRLAEGDRHEVNLTVIPLTN